MRIKVTPEQLDLLRQTVAELPRKDVIKKLPTLAKQIGCCVDTLKRILVRHDIMAFHGEKYVVARKVEEFRTWNKPCIHCKSTETRPKNQYICDPCKSKYSEIY